jgi:hypothetical protein
MRLEAVSDNRESHRRRARGLESRLVGRSLCSVADGIQPNCFSVPSRTRSHHSFFASPLGLGAAVLKLATWQVTGVHLGPLEPATPSRMRAEGHPRPVENVGVAGAVAGVRNDPSNRLRKTHGPKHVTLHKGLPVLRPETELACNSRLVHPPSEECTTHLEVCRAGCHRPAGLKPKERRVSRDEQRAREPVRLRLLVAVPSSATVYHCDRWAVFKENVRHLMGDRVREPTGRVPRVVEDCAARPANHREG